VDRPRRLARPQRLRKIQSEARQALVDYFDYARDNDLYLSYVIINPQADKSKGSAAPVQRVRHLMAVVMSALRKHPTVQSQLFDPKLRSGKMVRFLARCKMESRGS
jgi:hypothetical protein